MQKGGAMCSEMQRTHSCNKGESTYKAEFFLSEGGQTLAEVSRKLGVLILGDVQSWTRQP